MVRRTSDARRELARAVQTAFGKRLAEARENSRSKPSQQELAVALGVTRASVSNIERGRQRVSLDQVYSAARFLQLKAMDLMPPDDTLTSGGTVSTSPTSLIPIDQLESLDQVARNVKARVARRKEGR